MTEVLRSRIVVYKRCKFHSRHTHADPEELERNCTDCRRAGFRATMKARGITVTVPTYKGVAGTLNGYTSDYGRVADMRQMVWQFPERIPGHPLYVNR